MTKISKTLICGALALTLSACSSTSTPSSSPQSTASAETTGTETSTYDPAGLIEWMNENPNAWMSVDNGYWSDDPADQPTHEELETMLNTAIKAQLAVQYSEVFMVVLTDYEDQFDVIGDYWDNSGQAIGPSVTNGTVTVLFYADKIRDQEDHALPYGTYTLADGTESPLGSYYQQAASSSYMDTGITIAWLQFAAHALGYNTHIFGSLQGDVAVSNPTYYLENQNLMRGWGFAHTYGEDIKDIPVDGNMNLVAAVVIGKPAADVDATTAASKHMRPTNYSFFDESNIVEPTDQNDAQTQVDASDSDTSSSASTDAQTSATTENAE